MFAEGGFAANANKPLLRNWALDSVQFCCEQHVRDSVSPSYADIVLTSTRRMVVDSEITSVFLVDGHEIAVYESETPDCGSAANGYFRVNFRAHEARNGTEL